MRWTTASFFLLLIGGLQAQTGVRLVLWDYELHTAGALRGSQYVGFGVDHDVSERGSIGLDLRMGIAESNSWGVQYRSAYHCSDNENGSFYLGPTIGFARVGDEDPVSVVPLGFRLGVRGGLEAFYADLYAGVVTSLGGGGAASSNEDEVDPTSGPRIMIGLNLGFGWAGSEDR